MTTTAWLGVALVAVWVIAIIIWAVDDHRKWKQRNEGDDDDAL